MGEGLGEGLETGEARPPRRPVIEIQGLGVASVRAGSPRNRLGDKGSVGGGEPREGLAEGLAEPIYRDVDLRAAEGELVLLLGPSGGGKSLLANYLMNIVDPLTETLLLDEGAALRVWVDDRPLEVLADVYPPDLRGRIGIMFQGLGLFEDLTAEDNLRFANDQARTPRRGEEWALWLARTWRALGLDEGLRGEPVGRLSGGQRQRVALGRMLAYRPEIMIFDEPTSALDPQAARNAVALIRDAHVRGDSRLTLVITHDYERFLPAADRVWFLTQERRFVDDAPPRAAAVYAALLEAERLPAGRPLPEDERLTHEARCRDRWWESAVERGLLALARGRKSLLNPWFPRYLGHFFREIVVKGLPFHLLAGFFLGLVATYFSFNAELGSVPVADGRTVAVSRFIVPTFFTDMLTGFGKVLYRALIPLFSCVFVAARAGTAVTAYLAEMRDERTRQWDALRAFGVDPYFFFVPQLVICFALGCILLSYAAFWCAAAGSLLISLVTNPLCSFYTWYDSFWLGLSPRYGFWFAGSELLLLKAGLSGTAIALISTHFGTRPRRTSLDTMKHLSAANVLSIMAILCIFFAILVWEMG